MGALIGVFAFNTTNVSAKDVDFSVNLETSSTLVLPSAPVNLLIEPTANGRFTSGSFNVTAYSNSPAGYTLTMTTTSTALVSSTVDTMTGTFPTIPTLSASATESTFELNKWGISTDGTNYLPMEEAYTLADTTATGATANGVTTTVNIGTKLDFDTLPGTYSTTINIALVADIPPTTLGDAYGAAGKSHAIVNGERYYRMQDMTPTICANATADSEVQVVDARDNKIYWILKARDGNCWMTQNLDHDIVTTANFYTPENTDIASAWTPVRATIQPTDIDSTTGAITGWVNDASTPYSVNPGDYYWTDTWYNSNDCPFNAENDYLGCNYLAGGANNKFNTTAYTNNGEHGHVGNYYNWSAAVASNNTSSVSTDGANMNSSICPKGWRLPTVSSTNEFTNLFNAYDAYDTTANYRDQELASSPLYFVRGGSIWTGSLHGAGFGGYYVSSTNNSASAAYYIAFNSGSMNLANTSNRINGSSVRCVAR